MREVRKTSLHRRVPAVVATAVLASGPLTVAGAAEGATPSDRNGAQPSATAATTQALEFGQWTNFDVGRTGSKSLVFTFFSDSPALLRVTDALCRGDQFRAFDRGFAIFNTSRVAIDPSCDDVPFVTTSPQAWADPSYSKGRFLLQPGHHRVRIQITDSPFGVASAFLRIDKRPIS
jgi:hypothetical protein